MSERVPRTCRYCGKGYEAIRNSAMRNAFCADCRFVLSRRVEREYYVDAA